MSDYMPLERQLAEALRLADNQQDDIVRLMNERNAAHIENGHLTALAFLLYRALCDKPIEDLTWLTLEQKTLLARVVETINGSRIQVRGDVDE